MTDKERIAELEKELLKSKEEVLTLHKVFNELLNRLIHSEIEMEKYSNLNKRG